MAPGRLQIANRGQKPQVDCFLPSLARFFLLTRTCRTKQAVCQTKWATPPHQKPAAQTSFALLPEIAVDPPAHQGFPFPNCVANPPAETGLPLQNCTTPLSNPAVLMLRRLEYSLRSTAHQNRAVPQWCRTVLDGETCSYRRIHNALPEQNEDISGAELYDTFLGEREDDFDGMSP